jgi:hypothetical protein
MRCALRIGPWVIIATNEKLELGECETVSNGILRAAEFS